MDTDDRPQQGPRRGFATAPPTVRSIELSLADPEHGSVGVRADFIYRPSDPWALTVLFRSERQSVRWCFARELLIRGVHRPAGDGDVRIRPSLDAERAAVVVFELCSPDGSVHLEGPSEQVVAFVQAVVEAVPEGTEDRHVDLDAELGRLLG